MMYMVPKSTNESRVHYSSRAARGVKTKAYWYEGRSKSFEANLCTEETD